MNWSPKQSSKWFADLPPVASIDLSRRFGQDVGSSKAEIGHRPGLQGSSNAVTRHRGFVEMRGDAPYFSFEKEK